MESLGQLTLEFTKNTVIGLVAASGLVWLAIGRDGGDFTHEEYTDWGTVISMENCKVSSSSLYCRLITDKVSFKKIDVTDFSHNNTPLSIGDRIGKRILSNDVKKQTFYVRNGVNAPHSSCFDWMPCFDK